MRVVFFGNILVWDLLTAQVTPIFRRTLSRQKEHLGFPRVANDLSRTRVANISDVVLGAVRRAWDAKGARKGAVQKL